eukprot:m.465737 g.465737  ORF g.465737 m.465737 type:complete len:203 (-) comp21629_c0_seq20:1231-1839(-)
MWPGVSTCCGWYGMCRVFFRGDRFRKCSVEGVVSRGTHCRTVLCVRVCMRVFMWVHIAGERLIACVLYAALARGDTKMLVDVSVNGGYKSKHMNSDVCVKMVRFGMDTWGKDLMEGKNMQQFIDDCYTTDPWEEVADNLVMVNFMSIRLRSVGLAMNYPVVVSSFWGSIAERVLQEEGLPYDIWTLDLMNEVTAGQLRIAKS